MAASVSTTVWDQCATWIMKRWLESEVWANKPAHIRLTVELTGSVLVLSSTANTNAEVW